MNRLGKLARLIAERDEYRLQRDLHMAAANKAEAELATARKWARRWKAAAAIFRRQAHTVKLMMAADRQRSQRDNYV